MNGDADCLPFALAYINLGVTFVIRLESPQYLVKFSFGNDVVSDFTRYCDKLLLDFEAYWLSKRP